MGILEGKVPLRCEDGALWLGEPERRALHLIRMRQGIELLPEGIRGGQGLRPRTYRWGHFQLSDVRITETLTADNAVESIVDGLLTHPLILGGMAKSDGAELFIDLTERKGLGVAYLQTSLSHRYTTEESAALRELIYKICMIWATTEEFRQILTDDSTLSAFVARVEQWDGRASRLWEVWPGSGQGS